MMEQWGSVEETFLRPPYKLHVCKLSRKIRIAASGVITLAFLEHLFYLANSVYNHVVKNDIHVENLLDYFLRHQMGFIYNYVPFSIPFGLLNEIMNTSFTFGWNYMELFVMMVSLGLSTRFQQVNARLKTFRGKVIAEYRWARIREDYSALCNLVEIIDYDLRYLILLSNLNNLYFICYQLLNIFE
jgi:gustatory receptor